LRMIASKRQELDCLQIVEQELEMLEVKQHHFDGAL